MTRDLPELTEVEFARAIAGPVRRRLCPGEARSGREVTALRHFLRMTKKEFGRAVGISLNTRQNWEQ